MSTPILQVAVTCSQIALVPQHYGEEHFMFVLAGVWEDIHILGGWADA